jgi:hypothetical protein
MEQQGFTAIYCGAQDCPSRGTGPDIAARLREAVQRCPHGLLVRGECVLRLLGRSGWPFSGRCQHHGGAGAFVIVQPCDAGRRATGPAAVAGPLHEDSDVDDLCRWLVEDVPSSAPLPGHLRPTVVAGPAEH